jgi:hypothetical protein
MEDIVREIKYNLIGGFALIDSDRRQDVSVEKVRQADRAGVFRNEGIGPDVYKFSNVRYSVTDPDSSCVYCEESFRLPFEEFVKEGRPESILVKKTLSFTSA